MHLLAVCHISTPLMPGVSKVLTRVHACSFKMTIKKSLLRGITHNRIDVMSVVWELSNQVWVRIFSLEPESAPYFMRPSSPNTSVSGYVGMLHLSASTIPQALSTDLLIIFVLFVMDWSGYLLVTYRSWGISCGVRPRVVRRANRNHGTRRSG